MDANALNGLKVLVVEDEVLVAMLIEDFLADLGCEVAFLANRVGKALKSVEATRFDVAVLDVNVAGESIEPVVDALRRLGKPFVFASGFAPSEIDPRWEGHPILEKPFTRDALGEALLTSVKAR